MVRPQRLHQPHSASGLRRLGSARPRRLDLGSRAMVTKSPIHSSHDVYLVASRLRSGLGDFSRTARGEALMTTVGKSRGWLDCASLVKDQLLPALACVDAQAGRPRRSGNGSIRIAEVRARKGGCHTSGNSVQRPDWGSRRGNTTRRSGKEHL